MTHELHAQLAALEAANILRQVQPGSDAEYWFKHSMIQDAVYGSLLKSTRADLHLRVARVAEELAPADSEERAPTLALHYERAGLAQPALRYLLEAGNQSLRRFASREALGFFDRALALLGQDEALPSLQILEACTGRGQALEALGDHPAARDNYEAMLRFARQIGGAAEQADALIRLVTVELLISGLSEGQVERLNEAVVLARGSGSPLLQTKALWNMGLAYRFEDPLRSFPYFEQAIAIARTHSDDPKMRERLAYVLADLAVAENVHGRIRGTDVHLMEASSIFRELDNRGMLADTLGSLGQFSYLVGDPATARRLTAEALAINRAIDNHWGIAYCAFGLLAPDLDAGAFEDALELGREAVEHARLVSFPALVGSDCAFISRCLYELSRREEAVTYAQEAAEAFARVPTLLWTTMSQVMASARQFLTGDAAQAWETIDGMVTRLGSQAAPLLGAAPMAAGWIAEIGVACAHYQEVRRYCDTLLPYLESEGVQRNAAELQYWCARSAAAEGEHETALTTLQQSRERMTQMNVQIMLWRIDAALADSLAATGDYPAAAAAHERSVATIEQLAAGIRDSALRESFLARPDVWQVLDAAGTRWGAVT